MRLMQATVFIPAYNEEKRIRNTIEATLSIPSVNRVIVINDCSQDKTASEALIAGATLITLPKRTGKGGALMAGLIENLNDEIIVFLDADLQQSAEQASLLIDAINSGEAELAIAKFPKPAKKSGFGKVKQLALDAISQVAPDFDCQSPLSGQRAIHPDCIHKILPLADGFGVEVVMTIKALEAGLKVKEIPTTMTHNQSKNDLHGILHRYKQYKDLKAALSKLSLV